MIRLEVGGLFENFYKTFLGINLDMLNLSEQLIGYKIFEEFDINVSTFLYIDNIQKLMDEGFIDQEIFKKSLELRTKFFHLQNSKFWNINSVKNSEKWREILQISEEINGLLDKRWSKEELSYLFNMI